MAPRRSPRFRCGLLDLDGDALDILVAHAQGTNLRMCCVAFNIRSNRSAAHTALGLLKSSHDEFLELHDLLRARGSELRLLQQRVAVSDAGGPLRAGLDVIIDNWFENLETDHPHVASNIGSVWQDLTSIMAMTDGMVSLPFFGRRLSDGDEKFQRKSYARVMIEGHRAHRQSLEALKTLKVTQQHFSELREMSLNLLGDAE